MPSECARCRPWRNTRPPRVVHVHRRPNDDAYGEVTLHPEGVLRSQTDPALELDPAEVLPAR